MLYQKRKTSGGGGFILRPSNHSHQHSVSTSLSVIGGSVKQKSDNK